MGSVKLPGAVAVVTGAARGIGAATVVALRARGAQVVAADIDGDALAEMAAATGATPCRCDVREPSYAEQLVDAARRTYGPVDVVVANAGIGYAGEFATMPDDRLVDLLDINARAPILLARAALPEMLKTGRGSIVLVTSIAGSLLVPRESAYSASKAALEAFAVPLREELRGTGVAVSTVVPSVVPTAFWDGRGEAYGRRWPRPVPVDRVGEAIADTVESGRPQVVVPPWFRLPMNIHRLTPGLYRALSRRFG
jgi:short-subunit dehydrogenase